ncbi:MAG TPA: serine/threonine-protein kinase [Pyrinomonadaceae bacterium]|jgi:serine/threonine-protein kinase
MKYCTVCNNRFEDNVTFCPNDGEALENDPSTLVNTTLDGQYHIESMLGKGGMGAVYRARHILLGDRVAIKVLPPQMRNNPEWLRRFRREGQAARRFRHPNAVTVYDLRTTSDGLIYMVMEYVEGRTLDAELKARGRYTPLEAFQVLEPVMSVLNAAHAMGVVHRDLKPENIMIGKGDAAHPVVKLLDLGIAKLREVAGTDTGGSTALTIAGQILGTPYYMSPEQWGEVSRDGNTEIDGRADIYSLGTVIYELVAGRRPFCGLSLQELRREHVNVTPRPLHELLQDVEPGFGRAVARAMSKDRGERQATPAELDAELRAALGLPQVDLSHLSFASTTAGAHDTSSQQPGAGGTQNVGAQAASLTGSIPEGRSTNAEVQAPTILTVDQAPPPHPARIEGAPTFPTAVAPAQAQAAPQHQQGAQPLPTMATNPNGPASAGYVGPTPSYTPHAPAQKRSSPVPIIIGVLAVLLLLGGVGGWLAWKGLKGDGGGAQSGGANKGGAGVATEGSGTGGAAAETEVLRYWLDVAPAGKGDKGVRAAGDAPLASGRSFKFHLVPNADGYFYIVGPGEKNAPTSFLTAKPVKESGLETNQAKGGADFYFPDGEKNWLGLDKTPGTDVFTVIFSQTPLSSPAFLSAPAYRPLTDAEQKELSDLRSKAASARTEVVGAGGAEPLVTVKLPRAKASGEPVIFDVRVEHK